MTAKFVAEVIDSTAVFKETIFDGKVLFCTGGGSGICKRMTEAVMRHGANSVIVGRNLDRLTTSAEELSNATGRTCIPAKADVREPNQLRDAVSKAITKFGRIDFVICGLSENGFKTVMQIDTVGVCASYYIKSFDKANQMGTFNTIKATVPHLRVTKGAYIHVSATLHYRATPFQAHVSAAKAAVDALSAVLAIEEGPYGIRSNVIAPGPIGGTEGYDRLSASDPHEPEGYVQKVYNRTMPLGRVGHVQDIANAAVFLFSDAANFITGQVLPVDGGNEHLREPFLPYPDCILDSEKAKSLIKPRL
ncbi:unnamed protein product [Somion occarium]|uniref:2,4-dienoyl-CoA reductase [(3E)-enoyl-CoA-producing] n=1 Tax=Somion occarium TaxID=3059160 RepID=A0ABP1CN92_9APHY